MRMPAELRTNGLRARCSPSWTGSDQPDGVRPGCRRKRVVSGASGPAWGLRIRALVRSRAEPSRNRSMHQRPGVRSARRGIFRIPERASHVQLYVPEGYRSARMRPRCPASGRQSRRASDIGIGRGCCGTALDRLHSHSQERRADSAQALAYAEIFVMNSMQWWREDAASGQVGVYVPDQSGGEYCELTREKT